MIMLNPVAKLLSTTALVLVGLLSLIFTPTSNIVITDWDGNYRYNAIVNGKPIIIQLEEEKEETNPDQPKPGKVKIIFKDSKQSTTLIYERDMQDGEISETDKVYIERVLQNIEKFHKDNHTINDKIKDTINNFWKVIQKKR